MKEKIEIIQQTLDIDEKAAEKALNLAEGNLEEALHMAQYVDKNHIVIHGKISYGSHPKTHGLFSIIWNGKEGELIKTNSVLSNKNNISDINLEVNNQVFTKALENISKEEEENNISRSIKAGLQNNFNPTEIFKLLELIKEEELEKITSIFKRKLEDILGEHIDIELYAKLITTAQLKATYPDLFITNEIAADDNDNEESKDKSFDLDITLSCIPIISATKGTKVRNLNEGDKIPVRITDSREIGKYLNKLLQNSSGITEGTIKKIDFNKNLKRYSILIQLGPNTYGSIIVEPEVKLTTSQIKKTKISESKNNKIPLSVFWLLSLIGILSLIIFWMY